MSPSELLDWFFNYYDTLDEAGRQRLWESMDMDNYNPAEIEPSAYKERLEQTLKMGKDMDPEGPYMKFLLFKFFDEFDWMLTPRWKKALIRIGLMKR